MESNWRYNVAEYGMSYSNWELAAHVSGTPYPFFEVLVKLTGNIGAVYQRASPVSDFALESLFLPPATHPHFPFGRQVDPD